MTDHPIITDNSVDSSSAVAWEGSNSHGHDHAVFYYEILKIKLMT